jgi:hypothetical protein
MYVDEKCRDKDGTATRSIPSFEAMQETAVSIRLPGDWLSTVAIAIVLISICDHYSSTTTLIS